MESQPTDTAAMRRHNAMVERLAARSAARSSSISRSTTDPSTTIHSVQSFLSRFSATKNSIESDLSNPNVELERIVGEINELDRLVAENSYFLPAYDLRSCLDSISSLRDSLRSLSVIPKKKFSFKNNPKPIPIAKGERQSNLGGGLEESESLDAKSSNLDEQNGACLNNLSPGFRNKRDCLLVKEFKSVDERHGDFTLSDLDSCEVFLKGRIRALFIHRMKNCKVYCGPVLGSIHIEVADGCLFVLASHQIRIHHAMQTDFYLRVRSRPIIEDCNGVRFAPYRLVYEGIDDELREAGLVDENGNWARVDDFKWLRAIQSPNWCILPEEERIDTQNINLDEKLE